jgi:hypothetical protein
MRKTLLSSAENQTCYQADEFGSKGVEDWRFGPRWKMRFGWTCRHGRRPALSPNCQATAYENAAAFQVSSSSVRLDYLSAESFVGFDGSLRNGCSYAGLRGFFLLANARSRLRR